MLKNGSGMLWKIWQPAASAARGHVPIVDEMAMVQHQAIVLDSRIESVEEAEAATERVAERAGFDEGERHRIAMAVREITVNAVMHGNAYDRGKKVTIEFDLSPGELVVSIRDEGSGFDTTGVADPLAPENLLRQSGRGIFLARAFMDEVEVQPTSSGTSVRLTKHRQAQAPSRS